MIIKESEDKRISALHIIAGLAIGDPLGGAELFGAEIVRHFDHSVCEPIVCAFWRRGGDAEKYWYDRLRSAGIEVFFATDFRGKFNIFDFMKGVKHIQGRFDSGEIAIIHSHFQVGSLATLLLRKRLRPEAILRTAHITIEWGPSFPGFLCRQTFTKWLFPLVFDREVAVSPDLVKQLDQRPGSKLVGRTSVFIPNGIATDRFTEVSPPTLEQFRLLGLSRDRLIVGSVGRLTEQKGYGYLLEAVPFVLEKYPETQFVLIGYGDMYNALMEKRAHLHLTENVKILGARQDVERWLKAMDIFVLPSLWEGLPTVIMEAMASEVPVIATNISGNRDLVHHGKTGWLVQPKDSKGLAKMLIEVLQDPAKRQRVAQEAYEKVVPQYSLSAIAKKYIHLYNELLRAER